MTRFDRIRVTKIAALVVAVQFLPPFALFIGLDTSLKVGTAAAAVFILLTALVTRTLIFRSPTHIRRSVEVGPLIFAAAAILITAVHASIANYFIELDIARLAQSLPLLFFLLASCIFLARILLSGTDQQIRTVINASTLLLGLCVLLRISGVGPRGIFEKPVFPFSEPSHFALAFSPVLLYHCVNSTSRAKWLWLAIGFGVAIGIESLTLIIGCFLASIVGRKLVLVLIGGAIAVVGVVPFNLTYFLDRLDFSSETQNLSSLVYLQGWQQLWESLERSNGWGVGFQQLGVHGTEVSSAMAIVAIFKLDGLNVMDGSFVFAKLVSELGLFGIALGLIFVVMAIRSFHALRHLKEPPIVTFARCVVVCFIIDMFFRGTGYFTGSTLLALTAISVLAQKRKNLSADDKLNIESINRSPVSA